MADPTKFVPGFDYSDFEQSNPTLPKPGAQLDNDFANLKQTTDQTIDALKDVRRSDGKLKNKIVTRDSLADDAVDAISAPVREQLEAAEAAAAAATDAKAAAELSADKATDAEHYASLWATSSDIVDDGVHEPGFSARRWAEAAETTAIPDGSLTPSKFQAGVLPVSTRNDIEGMLFSAGIKFVATRGYAAIGDGGKAQYVRVFSEPSHGLKVRSLDRFLPDETIDPNGGWWEISERRIYVDMCGPVDRTGQVDSSAAFQKAADYARIKKCGRVWTRNGTYLVAGVIYGSFTIFTAENRGATYVKVPDGANTFSLKSIGFDKWADSVPSTTAPVSNLRSYRWHSSPAGRNSAAAANNYVVGSIIVTNPVDPGITGNWENGEIWWQAISVNPATLVADRDVDWEQVPSLLGAIFSGFEGITFIGNSAAQDAPYKGLCHYGVAPHFRHIVGHDFGDWGLWWETPGQVYSALVGIPLQGVWEDVRFFDCGTPTSGNIYDNGQSDTTRFYTMSYVTKNKGFMHYIGAKAGGGRHYGFHYWTDDSTSNDDYNWAIWADAQASDWHGHAEGRVRLNGARHSGEFKIYKGSSTHRQNAPAIYLNNPSHCDIVARTHLFRNCFRIVGADGGYNRLAGFLSESVAGTGVVDLVFGQPLSETTIVTALNNINASDRYKLNGPQNRFHRPATLTRPALADAADPTTGWSFSSQGLQAIVGGVEALLVTAGEFISRKPVRVPSFTVATLPTTGISAGAVAYASNGRKASEGAGAGTGVLVYWSSGQWMSFRTDTAVAA